MKKLSAVFLMLLSGTASASTANLTWSHPVTNVDGSPIPTSGTGAIAQTRIEWGSCNSMGGFGTKESEVIVLYPLNSTTINGNFVGGETVCFRAFSKNNLGVESDASAVISKTFDIVKPRPPVLSTVATVAYSIKINSKGETRLARRVGTVDIGVPCMDYPQFTNKGVFHPVEFQYVNFKRAPKSSIVVAKCELV